MHSVHINIRNTVCIRLGAENSSMMVVFILQL